MESNLQVGCMTWLRLQYPEVWKVATAIPNGGKRPVRIINGRAVCTEGAKLKREGVKAGVSDVIIFRPNARYHGLHIEFKTRTGRQSDEQKIWQKRMMENGYLYVLIRDIDTFINTIEDYVQTY